MGFKSWVTSDSLTSSDLMTYLMKQAVIVCTSSTRPAAPVEGMTIYETDKKRLSVYDGTVYKRIAAVHGVGRTGCTIGRVNVQNVSLTNTPTIIGFDTEYTDPDGFYAPSGGTITVPTGLGGLYGITVETYWDAGVGTQGAYVGFRLPPSLTRQPTFHMGVNATSGAATVVWPIEDNEQVQATVLMTNGLGSNFTAYLNMWRIDG